MENKKHIPDMSVYEASEVWDEHEFREFDDVQEAHDLQFSLKKKKGIPGIELMTFAGNLRSEEAEGMLLAIEQDCRRIEFKEW